MLIRGEKYSENNLRTARLVHYLKLWVILASMSAGVRAQTGSFSGSAVNLGPVAVNTATPATTTLTFTFTAGGTIDAPAVLTLGAKNLDFTDAGTGTCSTNGTSYSYDVGNTCTVVVNFTPRYPGVRYGGVVLYNSSNSPIATAYIYGKGTGPQAVYSPAAQTTLGGGFTGAQGAAVDGNGNIYVTDHSTGYLSLKEIPAGCASSACVVNLVTFDMEPVSLAVDGAGNVYVGVELNGQGMVQEIPPGCTSTSCATTLGGGFGDVPGLAVDGRGNVYVADYGNMAVKEMPPGCASAACVTKLGGGFGTTTAGYGLYSVGVDGNDNVYVTDYNNPYPGLSQVDLIPPGCRSASCVGAIDTQHHGFNLVVTGTGDLYVLGVATVADTEVYELYEIPAGCASPSCETALLEESAGPGLLAIDGADNLYLDNSTYTAVLKLEQADPPSLTFAATPAGWTSADSPQTVTVENIGNKLLNVSAVSYPADFPETPGVTTDCTSSTDLAPNAFCTMSIDFSPLPASFAGSSTVLSESVNLTDNDLNRIGAMQAVSLNGSVTAPQPTMLAYGTSPAASVAPGGSAGSAITVDEEFPGGAVSPNSTDSINLTVTYPDTTTQTYAQTAVRGVATFNLGGVPLTEVGNYTYTASSTGLASVTASEVVKMPTYVVPATGVGSASAVQTATLTLPSNVTLGSIAVLTQGAPNLDFQTAAAGSCTVGTAYSAGQSCTVNFTFTPKYAGARNGAVVLYDNASPANIVATIYLQGIGNGPQVVFNSAPPISLGGGFDGLANGVAVDGGGNIDVADSFNRAVKQMPPGCASSACVTTLGGGFSEPWGVAVDGSGTIYIADFGGAAVYSMPPGCASSACVHPLGGGFSGPFGVAVDGSGNVYVADNTAQEVYEMPAGCASSACVTALGAGNRPTGVAVDGSGNIYVTLEISGELYKIPPGCASSSCWMSLAGGFATPLGVAVDGSGNVYVTNYTPHGPLRELPVGCDSSSCVVTLAGGAGSSNGVAIDGSGNV